MESKILLNSKEIEIILHRLACQLIENHNDFSNTVLIGLQPRGGFLANRLVQILKEDYNICDLQLGLLDITFYRDDFRRKEEPLEATPTKIDFLIEHKKVVIIDDVLYSGRSVRAALTALQAYGIQGKTIITRTSHSSKTDAHPSCRLLPHHQSHHSSTTDNARHRGAWKVLGPDEASLRCPPLQPLALS